MTLKIQSARRLRGIVEAPPDKSISHRAVIMASLADGTSHITNYLQGRDNDLTLQALRQLGVPVDQDGSSVTITGSDGNSLHESSDVLHVGMSAATMRFIAGLVASQPFLSILIGDPRTQERPMSRIIDPLRAMGAHVLGARNGTTAPLVIRGDALRGIDWQLPIA